jgi:hypothetical protein
MAFHTRSGDGAGSRKRYCSGISASSSAVKGTGGPSGQFRLIQRSRVSGIPSRLQCAVIASIIRILGSEPSGSSASLENSAANARSNCAIFGSAQFWASSK